MSSDLIGSRHYFLLSIWASGDFLLCCEPGEHLAELCVVRAARAAPCLPCAKGSSGLWVAKHWRHRDSSENVLLDFKSAAQTSQQQHRGVSTVPVQGHLPMPAAVQPGYLAQPRPRSGSPHPSPGHILPLAQAQHCRRGSSEPRAHSSSLHTPQSSRPSGWLHLRLFGCTPILLQLPFPGEPGFSPALLLVKDGRLYMRGSSHCSEKLSDHEVIHPALPGA